MSNNESHDDGGMGIWTQQLGEAAGANDRRVEFGIYLGSLIATGKMIEAQQLRGHLSIAEAELKPKIDRAMSIIYTLVGPTIDIETEAKLGEELHELQIAIMRGLREVAADEISHNAVSSNDRIAQPHHFTVIPPDWRRNLQ